MANTEKPPASKEAIAREESGKVVKDVVDRIAKGKFTREQVETIGRAVRDHQIRGAIRLQGTTLG